MIKWCLVILSIWTSSVYADKNKSYKLHSRSAIVYDLDSNQPIIRYNIDQQLAIASITKIVTAMVIADSQQDNNQVISITTEDVARSSLNGVKYGKSLPENTSLTRKQLTELMLFNSHNRAANALARSATGGYEHTIERMNTKVKEIGAQNTYFKDAVGLNEGNRSTANDLAIICSYFYRNYPRLTPLTIIPFQTITINDRPTIFRNTNKLVREHNMQFSMQKTGYTNIAGNCAVSIHKIRNKFVAVVIMAGSTSNYRWLDLEYLLSSAEKNITKRNLKNVR